MPVRLGQQARAAVFIDLKTLEYRRALDLQIQTVHKKIKNPSARDKIYFVQHPSVFTLGKRGGKENFSVPDSFLAEKKIDTVQTQRGGNITYHGPGQAVLYPIIDIERNKIGVKEFVHGLEEIMKRTARDFHINANRDDRNHGIWINNSKLGSVGISIKRGVSFHGLAMNINIDLEPFSWINPCGLKHIAMTSLKQELSRQKRDSHIPMSKIRDSFINHFSTIFSYTIQQ